MSISGVAAVGGASTSSSSIESQIARLRKQESDLTSQLRDLASSDEDAKTKELKQELLTAQIEAIETQIAQLLARQAQAAQAAAKASEQQTAASSAEQATTDATDAARRPSGSIDGKGYQVDVEL